MKPELTTEQRKLAKRHGTPAQFAQALYRAVPGSISMDEAALAIAKYNQVWAGRQQVQMQACKRCGGTGEEPNQKALAASLSRRRKQTGISLREIARRLNLSAAYLSDLEQGRRNWALERVDAYEKALAR